MAFGFARISRDARPEEISSGREPEMTPGGKPAAAFVAVDEIEAFEFEHVHGDTCSCNLRGE